MSFVVQMDPTQSVADVPEHPVIEVSGLEKRFRDVVAVDGVDLAVAPGSVFGLLGPNGAGKTTIVRILTTIMTPDAGRASVLGLDVAQYPQAVRDRIGLAGQYAAVDENLTGRENLRLIGRLNHLERKASQYRAGELLEQFGLTAAGDRTVKTYSGGMRRRLDLAAALVHRPPVLFLDEPTTGLDPQSRSDLWHTISELVGDGTTVLLTTQYLEEADRLADRIAVIDRGTKVAEGTVSELKSSFGSTIVEMTFTDTGDATRAAGVVATLGSVDRSVRSVELHVSRNDGAAVLEVARLLDGEQIVPASFVVREPTLDDVFLALTGAPAEANS